MNDQWAEMRREIEKLFRYPRGAFDPSSTFLRDAERLNKTLGEGFTWLENVIGPRQLLDRIEAGLEYPVRLARDIPRQLLGEVKPPSLDSLWRRRY